MHSLPRFIPALVLVILYVLIVISPLAPLALRSPVIAHALTSECAGECGLCGCAPERSASHTCCCWQKKLQQEHGNHYDDQEKSDCCKGDKAAPKSKTADISSRPCNSAKTMVLMGTEQTDVLPFRFNQGVLNVAETLLIASNPICQADWPDEPPDPPPKLNRRVLMQTCPESYMLGTTGSSAGTAMKHLNPEKRSEA